MFAFPYFVLELKKCYCLKKSIQDFKKMFMFLKNVSFFKYVYKFVKCLRFTKHSGIFSTTLAIKNLKILVSALEIGS